MMLGALVAALGGCAAIGFDSVTDSNNPLPQAASGGGGVGGTAGTVAGQSGSGGSSGQASGAGGSGGRSGQGGNAGSAGSINPLDDASVPLPDAGRPPVTGCTGKDEGDPCQDGLRCTVGDFCSGDRCVSGRDLDCDSPCNSGTCYEAQGGCVLTPLPNGTECGTPITAECVDGECSSPTIECSNGGECSPECINPICTVDCAAANACRPTCDGGEICTVDCRGTVECKMGCTDATCTMDCRESGTCDVDCSGPAAVCTIMCSDDSGCEGNECLDGATCILLCDEVESCGFQTCDGAEQQCPDGSVRCNDECPDEADPDAGL
jgi:hypothetical protein